MMRDIGRCVLRGGSLLLVSLITTSALLLSSGCAGEAECAVADQVNVLGVDISVGTKRYTLVRRVSGFHDKVEFFELYDGSPQFDECGKASLPPVAEEAYDVERGYIEALVFKDERLNIRYTDDPGEAVLPEYLTLTVE